MSGTFPEGSSCQADPDAACEWRESGARVLVVDDHGTYRLLLGSLLEKLGVSHLCCSDGRQALKALEALHYDVVITDCCMPVMDGYAMTRELRRRERAARSPACCVLAFTASLGPGDIQRCLACGMDGWLVKPIGLAKLREVLRYWLAAPQVRVGAVEPFSLSVHGRRPTRASLVAMFGSWEMTQPLLVSLIQEARDDLFILKHALACLDGTLTSQRLHRLMGSVAFLGNTGLEPRAVHLIERVNQSGVSDNAVALQDFFWDVEHYLQYLGSL
ncbi:MULTISPECIES: response regulator [Pseudomonas]|uniref:response regulator n=1 Tax=Pseudomonas TaxID=286 RepID=UPI001AEADD77|nr:MULTISPECIES: response regulator [unclassified Pseudomonas]MBP1127919.1 CheY-like chemotaxis protein [Pseudomonas sp. PvP025]MDQ0396857.1 CheY-like chemotaxis protein [Pseudomonas sp. PvP006]